MFFFSIFQHFFQEFSLLSIVNILILHDKNHTFWKSVWKFKKNRLFSILRIFKHNFSNKKLHSTIENYMIFLLYLSRKFERKMSSSFPTRCLTRVVKLLLLFKTTNISSEFSIFLYKKSSFVVWCPIFSIPNMQTIFGPWLLYEISAWSSLSCDTFQILSDWHAKHGR